MVKTIKIDGVDYSMKASALTSFSYKDFTGRSLLSDLGKFQKFDINNDFSVIDEITSIITSIAYVMIKEFDKGYDKSYEQFLENIPSLYDDYSWINEVVDLAVSPFSRKIQNNQSNK